MGGQEREQHVLIDSRKDMIAALVRGFSCTGACSMGPGPPYPYTCGASMPTRPSIR